MKLVDVYLAEVSSIHNLNEHGTLIETVDSNIPDEHVSMEFSDVLLAYCDAVDAGNDYMVLKDDR